MDSPGMLHHVIVRGIEKKPIADDDVDRNNFVERMGRLSQELETPVYAWVLMTNHAHALLRSEQAVLSTYMRGLLTVNYVLKWFGTNVKRARKGYRQFLKRRISMGRQPHLVGGGLVRSAGGWSEVKALKRIGIREKSDERILGGGEFVEQVLKETDLANKYRLATLNL